MFAFTKSIASRLACGFFAAGLSACTATALDVDSNHPGNPAAASGRLPVIEALKLELSDATSPVLGSGGEHAHEHAADGHESQAAPSDAGATRYTCSMHPEVITNEPGKCPKCGMALIPKKDEK